MITRIIIQAAFIWMGIMLSHMKWQSIFETMLLRNTMI